MTFTFDALSGSIFFICFGLMFLILVSRTEKADTVVGKCPLHPSTDDCIHRSGDKYRKKR